MALKLYGDPMSTCTARVLFCLHEKEADFKLVPVNLLAGEHKQPPFLAKNPFGVIPVLEDEDFTLFESRAITAYVAVKRKESGSDLLHQQNPERFYQKKKKNKTPKEAAMVKLWMEVEAHQFNPVVSNIVYQFLVAPVHGKTPDQAVIDENLEKLQQVLDVYEKRVSTTKYLAGDFYSGGSPPPSCPVTHYFMKTPWANMINDRTHLKAWWKNVSSRPPA